MTSKRDDPHGPSIINPENAAIAAEVIQDVYGASDTYAELLAGEFLSAVQADRYDDPVRSGMNYLWMAYSGGTTAENTTRRILNAITPKEI